MNTNQGAFALIGCGLLAMACGVLLFSVVGAGGAYYVLQQSHQQVLPPASSPDEAYSFEEEAKFLDDIVVDDGVGEAPDAGPAEDPVTPD